MKAQVPQAAGHPSAQLLSLYSAGDLAWITRLHIRYHVRHCAECERELSGFRSALGELKRDSAANAPPGLDWNRLEREMLGHCGGRGCGPLY